MAKEQEFLDDLKDNYKESVDGWSDIYKAASADTEFVYDVGEGQWPDTVRKLREDDDRPIITSNKLQKILRRIRGDGMMNRPSLKVIPADSVADPEMAKLYSGILREIEYLSSADIIYDTAYNNTISSSIGFWRIVTEDDETNPFIQNIRLKRVLNTLAVHFDPYAVEFNLEDARYCFVEELIKKDIYKRMYPKSDTVDFESSDMTSLFGDWMEGDKVRVAEYFYKDTTSKKIGLLEDGRIIDINPDNIELATALGHQIVREKNIDVVIFKWAKVNGAEILDEGIWAGKSIPIIPMFGDEIIVKGKKHYISLARGAKGAQQMFNYWATAATETVALAPKMPFIVDHRQIKGYEPEWQEANIHNRMYARYHHIQGIPRPQRENQAQVPNGIMSMMQSTAYEIEDHLGQYESSKGEASNERSGVAIQRRVAQSDKGTYLFVNNRTRSMICGGKQVIELIPKIYDTERALQILGEDGEHSRVDVNVPTPDGKINDLSVGKYDLIASVGASYSSMRQEMTETLISSMQYAPAIAPVIAPLIFKYSDAPGAQEVHAELTKALQQMQQQEQPK